MLIHIVQREIERVQVTDVLRGYFGVTMGQQRGHCYR